jgi:CheY-like chemotaxis protein
MSSSPSVTPGPETLAIIEPDVLARMTIAEYLRECGYRVIEATDPEEIFTLLEAGSAIDVVLCEVRMKGELDGLAFAKTVRERYPQTDVILSLGVAAAAEKAGALCEQAPLEKPYHPVELLRRIQLLRERRRLNQAPPTRA